ncbi:MAG TPA: beta-propeller domain-containing protein [Kofleriaceae bacterium]|nr:beta-propeller domain-containing protein [Kofleriaceae bacterium]
MRLSVSLAMLAATLAGCSSSRERSAGQTSFESAPPNGISRLGATSGSGDSAGGEAPPSASPPPGGSTRTVEETDLYRLEGNRLYYLNAYRGLMVFDVTNPDQPALLGRSPIFGQPVDMIVRNGVAIVVIGDWYGVMDDGSPFHGSIVRGLDATDPKNIRVLGEAKLGGWVRDDRVVGDVIYAVSEDFGWWYGWDVAGAPGGVGTSVNRESVIVSSVSFANGTIQQVDRLAFDGFNGVFNVTPSAIMLASSGATDQTSLLYLDISDPAGAIVERGSIDVSGRVNGWGTDNGRWNLDFADGKTAHVIGQTGNFNGGYMLSTVDFSNPDAPVLDSALPIANTGWGAAARFDTNRLYLSPDGGYYWDGTNTTPFQVYDLTNPLTPKLAGTINVPGTVWNILPAPGSRMFALGNDFQSPNEGDPVSLQYLDVSDLAAPKLLGTATFGQGWAWTPAAGTFKAFTMDATSGLVVLPFSGWDFAGQGYNNGLQLIEFTPSSVTTAGAARTKGWVERGIFVGNRLVSLSPLSLAVVDYADRAAPRVISELTLARNVVAAQPSGGVIAEVSSDWWGNETTTSEVRVLPVDSAEETADIAGVAKVDVAGTGARVFTNGPHSYVVTNVRTEIPCPNGSGTCAGSAEQVQVVDIENGAPVLRGKIQLPADTSGWYGWGWEGFWWFDWWWGTGVVQVGGDLLAFRREVPRYDFKGAFLNSASNLYVVDLANPDAPRISSVVIQHDPDGWWGNMKVVGDTLYTTHYEWVDDPSEQYGWVRYYLDSVDLGDRAHPRIGASVNVPGVLVGGDAADPSIIYTIDYRWEGDQPVNDFDVLQIHGATARLLSQTPISGWVGSSFVHGTQAYLSAQQYLGPITGTSPIVELHAIDLSNPSRPRDRIASEHGWGWLLSVIGDRALVTSGWGSGEAIDVYRLQDGRAPQFEQTVRTRGWSLSNVSRQDQTLFLSSGYWGVQKISLQ